VPGLPRPGPGASDTVVAREQELMRIAIDAMGGDRAPRAPVLGSLRAAELLPEAQLLLVGDQARIDEVLLAASDVPSNIQVVPASEVIEMGEKPAIAVRRKKDSSIVRAVRMCKEGEADCFISAGNTGACVAATMFVWKRLSGVERPGIAVTLPTLGTSTVLCDAGANVSCRAVHLLHYAVMASVYVKLIKDVQEPRVGLLSIGEEEEKGNQLVKQTLALFQESELSCGAVPVEGQDIFRGGFDVVVCDGFIGNVILKTAEGLAQILIKMFMEAVQGDEVEAALLPAIQGTVRQVMQRTDYAETGGAPLLGVDGTCVIAHGRSDEKAIANGIQVAERIARRNLNQIILEELAELRDPPPV
jgi:glycerol-3-phosphate acyltransferase PlsX